MPIRLRCVILFQVLLAWLTVGLGWARADHNHCVCSGCSHRVRVTAWRQHETENFVVHTCTPDVDLRAAAKQIETEHTRLAAQWLGTNARVWQPKCMVLLCPTEQTYRAAVGRGAEQTAGASLVDIAEGQVRSRRIEIRLDRHGWQTGALPHELTHVLIADRFLPQRPPRWADEGIALLADTSEKRALHLRDLQAAFASGHSFRLPELFARDAYPARDRWPAFYGQSLSLAEFLVARGSPEKFVDYLVLAEARGHDHALAELYGIAGIESLERLWRASLTERPTALVVQSRSSCTAGDPWAPARENDPEAPNPLILQWGVAFPHREGTLHGTSPRAGSRRQHSLDLL